MSRPPTREESDAWFGLAIQGDPDELERRYRAMTEQIRASSHVLHAAARTADGLLIVDMCPSEEAHRAFFGSDRVRAMLVAHGLRNGVVEDFPVVVANARRSVLTDATWNDT